MPVADPTQPFAKASKDAKPSTAQVYKIARTACEVLGLDYPASRFEASAVISQLCAAASIAQAVAAGDALPETSPDVLADCPL